MIMKRILLTYIVVLAIAQSAFSQVTNYDFYAFRTGNMFNVNPAWVTKDEGINVLLNTQIMGSTLGYAQRNLSAGVYSQAGNNSGLGLKVISDSRGAFQTLHADVSYGFNARFSEGHSLRMGVLAGLENSNINISRLDSYELIDMSDPTLSSNYYNNTQFVAGAGLLYSFHDLEVSASVPQIVSTSKPFNSYVNAAAFYRIKAGEKFVVQPWISYQHIPVTKSLMGGYVKASYKDVLWMQAGYQNNKCFAGALGVTYENVGLSYGVRPSNPEFKEVAGGVHEIAFTLRITRKKAKSEKTTTATSTGLEDIMSRLDNLLNQDITTRNESDLRAELNAIKQMLAKAEIDNSAPGKAKIVQQQLTAIEEKIRAIEKKLNP
jgi:type IX secretion system PorP/SprF family membrane protein